MVWFGSVRFQGKETEPSLGIPFFFNAHNYIYLRNKQKNANDADVDWRPSRGLGVWLLLDIHKCGDMQERLAYACYTIPISPYMDMNMDMDMDIV